MFAKVVALTAIVALAEAVELKSEVCPLMAAMNAAKGAAATPTVSHAQPSHQHTSHQQPSHQHTSGGYHTGLVQPDYSNDVNLFGTASGSGAGQVYGGAHSYEYNYNYGAQPKPHVPAPAPVHHAPAPVHHAPAPAAKKEKAYGYEKKTYDHHGQAATQ